MKGETPSSKPWSPYLGGVLSGVLIILSVWATGRYFGASTAFVRSAGFIQGGVLPEQTRSLEYFSRYAPILDWQMFFLIGIFLGALAASLWSRGFRSTPVPRTWEKRFGSSRSKRGAAAFLGGLLLMFGARLAGGGPSGQGMSGVLQLSVSGCITMICFFAGGILAAHLLYGRKK